MIREEDIRNAKRSTMFIDFSRSRYGRVTSFEGFPRITWSVYGERGGREERFWSVDGWKMQDLAEAITYLNKPARKPPPSIAEQITQEVARLCKGPRPSARELAEELHRENGHRTGVYLKQAEEGKISPKLAAKRLYLTGWLEEHFEAIAKEEEARGDLFGGQNV